MKRLIVSLLLGCCFFLAYGQNINVDGFILGGDKISAIGNVAKHPAGLKYKSSEISSLTYASADEKLAYTLQFRDDRLYKITKTEIPDLNQQHIDTHLSIKRADLLFEFGEPLIADSKVMMWNSNGNKITFTYRLLEDWKGMSVSISYFLITEYETTQTSNRPTGTTQHTSSGSGIVLAKNGIIATNYHVIENANQIDVTINRNGEVKTYSAQIIVTDKTNDLALLQITDNNFTPYQRIPYGFRVNISDVGTSVFAMGYPMSNYLGEEVKVTDGIINAKTGYQGDIVTYQISAPIQSGNSGGPLFDKQGYLIGITNAGIPDASVVGYAIKSSYLKNLIEVAPSNITLPAQNSISNLSFTEKVKVLSEYVVYIRIK